MPEIPLWLTADEPAGRSDEALVLMTTRPPPTGYAVVRHAAAAAVAQAGACSCCHVPSNLALVLRQLFLDRVRGITDFNAVIVAADGDSPVREAMSDPLVAARFVYRGLTDARVPSASPGWSRGRAESRAARPRRA